jgi:alpha-L-fucosidase
MRKLCLLILIFLNLCLSAQQTEFIPVPSSAQLEAQQMEFYLFVHFGPNTFTGQEWGYGDEPAEVFNPTALDCGQWCRIAKAAGAKGIIITAKHHDGFCLFPSKYSTHTVRESKWMDGKGDVLRQLSDSCKFYGLKFGVYLSPWDRNHPDYGTDAYNKVYTGMIREVFENYGPIWEFWFDGACGEGPNGKKQVYDWDLFHSTIRQLSPQTVMFSDVGPDLRWVGNENGFAGITHWYTLNTKGYTPGSGAPSQDTLTSGNVYGEFYIPAECDVSIRNGWFYRPQEDSTVKSAGQLFNIYLKSVGRGANLLLNVPPDTRGRFASPDSAALMQFKKLNDNAFANDLLSGSKFKTKSGRKALLVDTYVLKKPVPVNCLILKEELKNGQAVVSGFAEFFVDGKSVFKIPFSTIGHKRILTFNTIETDKINVVIATAKVKPSLLKAEAYRVDEGLLERQ